MDLITPLLTDPAAPRLTTYTDQGRMELSGMTLSNWQAKVANLLDSVGVGEGDTVAIAAAPGWLPACIAIGAWRIGASISDANSGAPEALFTDSVELAESYTDAQEVFLLSTDPFGRGVEEAGGEVPFGITDFAPELRVQPDAFMGGEPSQPSGDAEALQRFAAELGVSAGERVCVAGWSDVAGLMRCLAPLTVGGSVVISSDASPERLQQLACTENARPTA